MSERQFTMSPEIIAKTLGTVGSPLIVISELIKNAFDASAKDIDITYDIEDSQIIVENKQRGFMLKDIELLAAPGTSSKKTKFLKNDNGLFQTGSKGLGLLSVFVLCNEAEILTVTEDEVKHQIIMNRDKGTITDLVLNGKSKKFYTRITMRDVGKDIIGILSSPMEITKLKHISTYTYMENRSLFPIIKLHIKGKEDQEINTSFTFPRMTYDVNFSFDRNAQQLSFCCKAKKPNINSKTILLKRFTQRSLKQVIKSKYNIITAFLPDAISALPEELLDDMSKVPSFEGRLLVYEDRMAGKDLKEYGAGVNIYVNDFAIYNYLASQNDWLQLGDFSQRKKATRLKPHNVFGYVNLPEFNENKEDLRISNERADFIQDPTYLKLMYLIKGVVMYLIFNIDVADKNPKFKDDNDDPSVETEDDNYEEDDGDNEENEIEEKHHKKKKDSRKPSEAAQDPTIYTPDKKKEDKLHFTEDEGKVIDALKGKNDLCNKIHTLVYELAKLNINKHCYSNAFLFRALLESSTKYLANKVNTEPQKQTVIFKELELETSIINAINYFSNNKKQSLKFENKTTKTWRTLVKDTKLGRVKKTL